MTQSDAHETLLEASREAARWVREAIPSAHANVQPGRLGDDRFSVITALAVGDAASKAFDDVVITLRISPAAWWRPTHTWLEADGCAEVAVASLEAGSGRDLIDPLIWPLPGQPESPENEEAISLFAAAAKQLLRENESLIVDVLRQAIRDEHRR